MTRWFRFYADAMRNPKVLRLSDKDFRLWVGLMALASENDGKIPSDDDLRLVLGMRLDHLQGGLNRLISGGLIDTLDDGYEPHHWSKFQYKSDTSNDRVAKHRAKRNVTVTPPDTDTDTEEDKSDANASPRAKRAAPRGARLEEDWVPTKPLPDEVQKLVSQWPDGRIKRELDQFRDYWTSRQRDAARTDWDKTWWNRIRDQHDRILRESRNVQHGIRKSDPVSPSLAFLRYADTLDDAPEAIGSSSQVYRPIGSRM
jgi:hypothetical protein